MPVCLSVSVSPRCRWPPGAQAGVSPVPLSCRDSRCRCPLVRLCRCTLSPPPWPPPAVSSVTTLCLQGHSSPVTCLDFSSNGKYLASCSEDRTVRLWSTRDLAGREHRCLRANVGLDHAELVRLSPDSRYGRTLYQHRDVLQRHKSHGQDVVG